MIDILLKDSFGGELVWKLKWLEVLLDQFIWMR
jgi:hypothetical protein